MTFGFCKLSIGGFVICFVDRFRLKPFGQFPHCTFSTTIKVDPKHFWARVVMAEKKMQMIDSRENPYLEQEVFSASPAKLRWLLITKACN